MEELLNKCEEIANQLGVSNDKEVMDNALSAPKGQGTHIFEAASRYMEIKNLEPIMKRHAADLTQYNIDATKLVEVYIATMEEFIEEYKEETEKYYDKVRVRCHICQKEHENQLIFGENEKYPDDYYIKCKTDACENWEEGNGQLQTFDVLETYGRFEMKEEG